jgi:hypothetical protein
MRMGPNPSPSQLLIRVTGRFLRVAGDPDGTATARIHRHVSRFSNVDCFLMHRNPSGIVFHPKKKME